MLRHEKKNKKEGKRVETQGEMRMNVSDDAVSFFQVWRVIKRIINWRNNLEKKESSFDGCTIKMERHNIDSRTTVRRFRITFEIRSSWKKIKMVYYVLSYIGLLEASCIVLSCVFVLRFYKITNWAEFLFAIKL